LARQASIMVWFPMTLPTAICYRMCETSREQPVHVVRDAHTHTHTH
jgi:hypothetical protein